MKTYFAYGSNMSSEVMHKVCPHAVEMGAGRIDGWKLVFPHLSRPNLGFVANIEPGDDDWDCVWGVLWQLDGKEWVHLGIKEGFRGARNSAINTYVPTILVVKTDGEPFSLSAVAFIINPEKIGPLPSKQYMSHLILGAFAHRLPDEYINHLASIPTQ